MAKKKEQYCGNCAWFYAEDTYGFGGCTHQFAVTRKCEYKCNVDKFVSREEMRHHLAVLTQIKRILRYQEVGEYTRVNVPPRKDQKKALDFVVEYVKTYSKL